MKKILFLILCGITLTGIFSFHAAPMHKTPAEKNKKLPDQTITLTGLQTKRYVPPKGPGSGGDNDFFGHGPAVKIKVEIYVKAKVTLYARVTFEAREVGGDGSCAMGSREEMIYFAGFGNEIIAINSPVVSNLTFTDDDHSDDYVGANGRVKAGDAKAYWNEFPSFVSAGDLVRFCVVTGDTEGQEIGGRTGIRVYFNPITIKLKNPPPALIDNVDLNVTGSPGCGESTCSASCGAGLLQFYGNAVTCAQFWDRERSVGHFVNWARDNHIANMGMPPNVLRDKLKDWKSDVQLRNLTNTNFVTEIKKIIKDQHRPVIALVAWGSRAVKDYYVPGDDSYGVGNAIVHYVIIDGWDKGTQGNQTYWHVIDNGVHKKWTHEYFSNAFWWRPENFIIEGLLYPQDVHPGNIVY